MILLLTGFGLGSLQGLVEGVLGFRALIFNDGVP